MSTGSFKNREIIYLVIVILVFFFSLSGFIKKVGDENYARSLIIKESTVNLEVTNGKEYALPYIQKYRDFLYQNPERAQSKLIRNAAVIGSVLVLRVTNIIMFIPLMMVVFLAFGIEGYIAQKIKMLEFKITSPVIFHYIQRLYFIFYTVVLISYFCSGVFINPYIVCGGLLFMSAITAYVVMSNVPLGKI